MMRKTMLAVAVLASMSLTGCMKVVPTGEVGVRQNFSNQIESVELQPGSWNQTIFGNVLLFPVREIPIEVNDTKPLTADNAAMGDFDVRVVYSINSASVAEIYSTKSRAFHTVDQHGEIYLMHSYLSTLIVNAENKAVRKYKSLEVSDNQAKIEIEIRDFITQELKNEKLDSAIQITAVQVRSAKPNQTILDSATNLVKSQNDLKIKDNEVQIAKKEAERQQALSNVSEQSIKFMHAKAELNISEGVKEGKVATIIIPSTMTALGTIK